MIIRGTPPDPENYKRVNDVESNWLHMAGYHPSYIDEKWIYYKLTPQLESKYNRILRKKRRMIYGKTNGAI